MRGILLMVALPLCAQTRLEDLERRALASNPATAQAEAGVRAAAGRARQAGLYPNPVIGATGEHNTPVLNGGSMGGYVEQRIVMGGKLGLSKQAADRDRMVAVEMQNATRLRLLTVVRTLFYRGLGEQRLVEVRREMAALAHRTADTIGELKNIGQADSPDLLTAEIETQRADLAVTMAQNALERTLREIGSVVNGAVTGKLEGDLETLPKLDSGAALSRVLAESPAVKIAAVEAARAETLVARARVERIPDLTVRGGVRHNNEPIEKLSGVSRPVGNEAIFDVGIQLPLFNRNQGGIAAARADAESARLEVDREKLALQRRFAGTFREYADATAAAARYRDEMIPRARQAFDMYASGFRQMSSSYPQVLATQRSLIQLEDDYIAQLIAAWRAAVEIEGLLVSDPAALQSWP